jgi:MULE transposase domain.
LQKYGHKKGKQQYRCKQCQHQFSPRQRRPAWVKRAYHQYVKGKHSLQELRVIYRKSLPTLRKYFDQLPPENRPLRNETLSVNLIFDATFFSRHDGVLVFRANKKNLYWRFIDSETLQAIEESLRYLSANHYIFKSFTIDGRKGVIQLLERVFPGIPIQLCHFHQSQIIRRYTTNNPKTNCGKELKALIGKLTEIDETTFEQHLNYLRNKYHYFLLEKNENNQYIHRRLRSAIRSLKANLPYLFTYQKFPDLAIPNTTNSCDGSFAHWKQKLKIHRGLRKNRRNKMIDYLLNQG